jgi:hypothetical protein
LAALVPIGRHDFNIEIDFSGRELVALAMLKAEHVAGEVEPADLAPAVVEDLVGAPDLLPHPGAVVLRSDVERKALLGAAETDRLPADAYAPEMTARTYAVLIDKARRTVAAGHSAIVDAVFSDAAERDGRNPVAGQ